MQCNIIFCYGMKLYEMVRHVMWCDAMCCMWCDVLWCVVMCCDVLWCDVMWCYVMWCDVTQRKIVWYGSVKTWYGMVWRGMAWYGMVLYLYGNVWVLGFRLGLVCIYNSHAHTHTPCIYIYMECVCVCVSCTIRHLTRPSGVCQMRPTVRQYPEGCRCLSRQLDVQRVGWLRKEMVCTPGA